MYTTLCDSRYLLRKDDVEILFNYLDNSVVSHQLKRNLPLYYLATQDQQLKYELRADYHGANIIIAMLKKEPDVKQNGSDHLITRRVILWHGGHARLEELYKNNSTGSTVHRNARDNLNKTIQLLWTKALEGQSGLTYAYFNKKVKASPLYSFLLQIEDDPEVANSSIQNELGIALPPPQNSSYLPDGSFIFESADMINSSQVSVSARHATILQHNTAIPASAAAAAHSATLPISMVAGASPTAVGAASLIAMGAASPTAMVPAPPTAMVATVSAVLYVAWGCGSHLVKMGQATTAKSVLSRNTTHFGPIVYLYSVHPAQEVIDTFTLVQLENIMLYAAEIVLFVDCYEHDMLYDKYNAAPRLLRLTVRTNTSYACMPCCKPLINSLLLSYDCVCIHQ